MAVTLTIVATSESMTFNALAVRGFDDVDDVRFTMSVQNTATDGHMRGLSLGFQRVSTLSLGVVSDVAKQSFLARWVFAAERSVTYTGETARVVLVDPSRIKADVSSGKLFHRFTVQVADQTVRLDPPYAWQDAPITWTSWDQTNIRPFDDTDYTFDSLP